MQVIERQCVIRNGEIPKLVAEVWDDAVAFFFLQEDGIAIRDADERTADAESLEFSFSPLDFFRREFEPAVRHVDFTIPFRRLWRPAKEFITIDEFKAIVIPLVYILPEGQILWRQHFGTVNGELRKQIWIRAAQFFVGTMLVCDGIKQPELAIFRLLPQERLFVPERYRTNAEHGPELALDRRILGQNLLCPFLELLLLLCCTHWRGGQ